MQVESIDLSGFVSLAKSLRRFAKTATRLYGKPTGKKAAFLRREAKRTTQAEST